MADRLRILMEPVPGRTETECETSLAAMFAALRLGSSAIKLGTLEQQAATRRGDRLVLGRLSRLDMEGLARTATSVSQRYMSHALQLRGDEDHQMWRRALLLRDMAAVAKLHGREVARGLRTRA